MNAKMRGFVNGILLGVVGKPFPITQEEREPVAYLYNGVQLPKLPEWDEVTYPYALMYRRLPGTIELCVFDGEPYTYRLNEKLYTGLNTKVMAGRSNYTGTYWTELSYNEVTPMAQIDGSVLPTDNYPSYYIWANYDVLDEDGTVMHPKTEPIPVYE